MGAAPGQMEIVYRGNPKFLLVRPPTRGNTIAAQFRGIEMFLHFG
jgi:hypothetical protein